MEAREKERKERRGKSTVYLGDADDGLVNGWMKGGRGRGDSLNGQAGKPGLTDCSGAPNVFGNEAKREKSTSGEEE